MTNHFFSSVAVGAASSRRGEPQPPPPPPRRSSRARVASRSSNRRAAGAAAELAVPTSSRSRRRDGGREDDRQSALGRPRLRARVLHDAARHLSRRFRCRVDRRVPLERWRELGADGVLVGTVRKTATASIVQVRLIKVARPQSAFGKEWIGSIATRGSSRTRSADEIHQQQAGARRGAHQADVLVRSRRRAAEGTVEIARRQGDLHRRLRRREPAARHGQPQR